MLGFFRVFHVLQEQSKHNSKSWPTDLWSIPLFLERVLLSIFVAYPWFWAYFSMSIYIVFIYIVYMFHWNGKRKQHIKTTKTRNSSILPHADKNTFFWGAQSCWWPGPSPLQHLMALQHTPTPVASRGSPWQTPRRRESPWITGESHTFIYYFILWYLVVFCKLLNFMITSIHNYASYHFLNTVSIYSHLKKRLFCPRFVFRDPATLDFFF